MSETTSEAPSETTSEPPSAAGGGSSPSEPAPVSDVCRRSLRLWAVAEGVGGLALAALAVIFIPWKTSTINVLLLAYAAIHLAAGHGMWRGERWGWRLGIIGGFIGFVLGIALVTALVGSWSYLHGTFGDFGLGASIAALLFASIAVQVLLLYPALKLHGLLRGPMRAELGGGQRWVKAVFGLLFVPLLVGIGVDLRFTMSELPPLSEAARLEATAHLRAALEGRLRPPMPALAGVPTGPGPVYVTWYVRGHGRARVTAEGADLAEAVERAADALAAHDRVKGRKNTSGRIKVDRTVASGPLLADWPLVVALSINSGLDGLRRTVGASARTFLPEDHIKNQVFGVAPLVPGIRELRIGLDARRVLDRLGTEGTLERFRTEGWVETIDRKGVLPTHRGNTPPPGEGPDAWRAAAIAGGDFVLRQIRPDNRFYYQYFPLRDRHERKGAPYSIPRHAGTVYSLALLYGLTGEARFKIGAEKAMAWLIERLPDECGGPDRTCVAKQGRAVLGSSALTLVGMLEYQRRTGDARYAEPAARLAAFIRSMQRPNGDFFHSYNVASGVIDRDARLMFYSEEAALALVMAHKILGSAEDGAAAERALDYLTGPKYADYFLGWFIYGADHWTCIAAEEAWPALKKQQYLDFCVGYSDFVARLQYEPGAWDNDDFRGHYGFSGLMVPQAPGAAGFSEAVISTYALARYHEAPPAVVERLEAQIAGAMDALARDQLRLDNAWLMPNPEAARGGIRRSLVEQEVRIDFTQHALSALIRAEYEVRKAASPAPG